MKLWKGEKQWEMVEEVGMQERLKMSLTSLHPPVLPTQAAQASQHRMGN